MGDNYTTKSYVIKDFYQAYLDFIGTNKLYQVDLTTFRSILKDYIEYVNNEIFYKSREIKLPGRVGSICIVKKRPPIERARLRVDFRATNELKKTILHLNEHSEGFNYRFFWSKKDSIVRYKTAYELVMSRANKRKLASIIKNKQADYIEI